MNGDRWTAEREGRGGSRGWIHAPSRFLLQRLDPAVLELGSERRYLRLVGTLGNDLTVLQPSPVCSFHTTGFLASLT